MQSMALREQTRATHANGSLLRRVLFKAFSLPTKRTHRSKREGPPVGQRTPPATNRSAYSALPPHTRTPN